MNNKKDTPYGIWILTVCAVICALYAVVYKGYGMFTPEQEPILQGIDDSFYYFWLRSIVIDGDLDFYNELEMANTIDAETKEFVLNGSRTRNGLLPNKYPMGWAVASLPFFIFAHLISLVVGLPSTGFEPIYFIFIWIGQIGYSVTSLYLALKIISRYMPVNRAWMSMLLIWLSSPLLYYQTARVSMSHSTVFFLTILIYYLTFKILDKVSCWRHWLGLGFFSGLLVITRNTAVVYLIFPAVVIINYIISEIETRQKLNCLTVFLFPALITVFIQLLCWKILYSTWLIYTYEGESFNFLHPRIAKILFSHHHGLFNWHPLLIAGMAGLIFYTIKEKSIPKSWTVSLLTIIFINASWHNWWFGSSFGNRAFESSIFFAMLGFALLIDRNHKNRLFKISLYGLASIACVWNVILLTLYFKQLIARDIPVSYSDRWEALLKLIAS